MNEINIYMCGPTLFDYVHFGCYRIFVLSDIIDKHFTKKGYIVNHGMNVMDLDDKIIEFKRENKSFNVTEFYNSLKEEFNYLNIKYPNYETKTTDSIKCVEKIIDYFLKNELAYITDSGIYLDLSLIPNYGELSNMQIKKNKELIKINDKKSPCDPSLWRFTDSKYSYFYLDRMGRPGWDIQCACCCIEKMNSKIDYQFAGFNDVTHYENNKVIIENAYNYNGYKSKWILPRYINFVNDTPFFYMKDYIKKFSRQVIKYSIYSKSYKTQFDISKEHFNNSERDINKLNIFYQKLKDLDNFTTVINNNVECILNYFKNLDILFENLKIPSIIGNLFKLIRCMNRYNYNISYVQKEKIIDIINYLNDRLDFLYKGDEKNDNRCT